MTSTLHWFETELLTREENLVGLMAVNRDVIGQAETFDRSDRIVIDMDSTESPVHGQQEGSAYNGHFETVCYHPLFLFNDHGDCLAAKLRAGNVHSADDWDELLVPEIERQQAEGKQVVFRADAAFAKPELYEALEHRGVRYAIRIPANENLEWEIAGLLSASREAQPQAARPVQELFVSGRELDAASAGRRESRAPCRRAVPACRLHRDESPAPQSRRRAVLQQARDGGAMDQGRQAGRALDAALVSPVPGERGPAAVERAGLQPWEFVPAPGAAEARRQLVADQSAAAARQDRWASGEACAVLLAAVGGESPDPTPVRGDASADLGAADPDGLNRRPLTWESGKETEQGWKGVQEMPRN